MDKLYPLIAIDQAADARGRGGTVRHNSGCWLGAALVNSALMDLETAGQPVHIVADDRERAAPVVAILQGMEGVSVEVQRLKLGDYLIGDWLFERKALMDFAESVKDGRLFSQATRLLASGRAVAFILEGRAGDLARSRMRRESLQGALVSLSLVFQVPILRSAEAAETARLLCYAGHQLQRERAEWIYRHGRRPKRRRRQQLYVLEGLPGIGPQKAERLLARFGSVRAVFAAPPEELEQVPGIGEKIAGEIHRLLQPDESEPISSFPSTA